MSENFNNNRDIDLVDFSPNKEMEAIREQERIEREKRRIKAAQIRRAELLRRRRIEQIKQTVFAWATLVLGLIAVIALIVGVVSLFKGGDEKEDIPTVGESVTQNETDILNLLAANDSAVFEKDNGENDVFASASKMSKDLVSAVYEEANETVNGSDLSLITQAYIWNNSFGDIEKIKNTIRDFPMYSNGYIWSNEKSMKSPVTKSYMYDTNASFVSAVCNICLWEGDASFLSEIDVTGEANGDKSAGMTVGAKLDAVVSHFFDSDDYLNGGGVRYSESDGLVYVLTTDNNGRESGKPSNLFSNYRFGYIDTYNNIAFNEAMQNLAALYTLTGDKEKADKYKRIAETNKKAVNNRLYDKSLGRYVGYIDSNSEVHDAGFTAVNLFAISAGVADKEQAQSILGWISGERTVNSDSTPAEGILKYQIMPVFNTVKASEEIWDSFEGKYSIGENVSFGESWLNGGKSALAGSFYMLSDKKSAPGKAARLTSEFAKGNFALPEGEMSEPSLYYAFYASNAVKTLFGISTDGKTLNVIPSLRGENAGICGIAFSDNSYDILFHEGYVYITAETEEAVRLNIGSFGPEADVKITTVEDGKIISSENMKSDKDGAVSLKKKVGGKTYLKLEEIIVEE